MLACLLGRQNHILYQLGWLALLRALLQRLCHTLQEDNLVMVVVIIMTMSVVFFELFNSQVRGNLGKNASDLISVAGWNPPPLRMHERLLPESMACKMSILSRVLWNKVAFYHFGFKTPSLTLV